MCYFPEGNISCATAVYITMTYVHVGVGRSYVPRLANAVDVLAVRYVKQGTETAGLLTGFARTYLCVCCDIYTYITKKRTHTQKNWIYAVVLTGERVRTNCASPMAPFFVANGDAFIVANGAPYRHWRCDRHFNATINGDAIFKIAIRGFNYFWQLWATLLIMPDLRKIMQNVISLSLRLYNATEWLTLLALI